MIGTWRMDLDLQDSWTPDTRPQPGDYWRDSRGEWLAVTPNGLHGGLGNHNVTQHDDGTITVSPSILVNRGMTGATWHGYLERGVWRSA